MPLKNYIPLIEVPLGSEAHSFAGKFAIQENSTEKSKNVYLNTLAVYAVHRYLRWLGIETSLDRSDSWNPVLRGRWNIADLIVPGYGKIECCPILPNQESYLLPPETLEDRSAYIGVQFNETLDQVQLLGFVGVLPPSQSQLTVEELQPLENLLQHLEFLKDRGFLENDCLVPSDESLLREFIEKRTQQENQSDMVRVGDWFDGRTGRDNQRQGWRPPVPAIKVGFLGIEDFQPIVKSWEAKGVPIPNNAKASYRPLEIAQNRLELYAATWQLSSEDCSDSVIQADIPQKSQKWALLLILRAQTGGLLPQGIRFQVNSLAGECYDKILETKSSYLPEVDEPKYFVGDLEEKFFTTIALNGVASKELVFTSEADSASN